MEESRDEGSDRIFGPNIQFKSPKAARIAAATALRLASNSSSLPSEPSEHSISRGYSSSPTDIHNTFTHNFNTPTSAFKSSNPSSFPYSNASSRHDFNTQSNDTRSNFAETPTGTINKKIIPNSYHDLNYNVNNDVVNDTSTSDSRSDSVRNFFERSTPSPPPYKTNTTHQSNSSSLMSSPQSHSPHFPQTSSPPRHRVNPKHHPARKNYIFQSNLSFVLRIYSYSFKIAHQT
jgi:hypothetical protein